MVIATAFGWGNAAQMALAIALAYLFGFGLTALPLVRARLPWRQVVTTADTVSITIMELIDNLFILALPGSATPSSTARSPPASRSPFPSPTSPTAT